MLPTRVVLDSLSCFEHIELFRIQLVTLEQGPPQLGAAPPPQRRLSALQRTRNQFTAPQPNEARWHDAHEQPEHQALLLAHALRELIAQWAALVTDRDARRAAEISHDQVAAVLRGDFEFFFAERQFMPTLPAIGAGNSLLDDAFFREVLCCGAGSVGPLTGDCVPRRAAWLPN